MATTLDDLYRARRGHTNEQVENFLSAATGLLLDVNGVAARAFLQLYGIDVPTGARVRASCQEPLYHASSGESAGIPDILLTWPAKGTVRRVVVEAKVDLKLTREQPDRYAEADRAATVVTLTPHASDADLWPAHSTWSDWHAALGGIDSDLARALRAQIALRPELASPAPLALADIQRLGAESEVVAAWKQAMQPAVAALVPKSRRSSLPAFTSEDWQAERDVNSWFELSAYRSRKRGLPIRGLGLRLESGDGALGVVTSVLVGAARRRRLAASSSLPWCVEAGSDWLDARVGQFPADGTAVAAALLEPVHRARRLLTGDVGLWSRVSKPSALSDLPRTTGEELEAAIRQTEAVRESAERLGTLWLGAAHSRVELCLPCRRIDRSRSQFYVDDKRGAAQVQLYVGVDVEVPDRPAESWVWFKRKRPALDFARSMQDAGWTVTIEVHQGQEHNVYAHPPLPETLTSGDVQAWARVQADALVSALDG